jgi:hypothetical protein
MGKFPRFTSGSVGRLDYATMNDLFDRIESLEAVVAQASGGVKQRASEIVTCEVTGIQSTTGGCSIASWIEKGPPATGSACAFTGTQGSRSSIGPSGDFDYPLIGENLVAGQVYTAYATYRSDGKLIYRKLETGSAGVDVWLARITGGLPMPPFTDGKVYRWKYSWREVIFQGVGPPTSTDLDYVDKPNGRVGDGVQNSLAWNTLERNGMVGVGGGSTAQEGPAKISDGIVVLMHKFPDAFWVHFNAGPGLNVTCI